MHEAERRMASLDGNGGVGARSTLGGEVLQRPAVEDERVFDRDLVQRRVHRFAES